MENKAYKEPVKVTSVNGITLEGIDFYAVKETGWTPVSRCGLVLGIGGKIHGTPDDKVRYLLYRGVPIHRIVATTFIPNTDPKKIFVNHIDGNKQNNHVSNLEWVTPSENCTHAYQTGLRPDNKHVLAKDIDTGEILEFKTIWECGRHFKVNGGTIHRILNKPQVRPFKLKYDLTFKGNEFNGFTKDDVVMLEEKGTNRLVIAINKDDENDSIIFSNNKVAAAKFGSSPALINWYIGCNGAGEFKNLHKGYRWYYLRDYSKTREQTDKLIEQSVKELEPYKFNMNPNNKRPRKLRITNLETGEIQVWDSIKVYAQAKGVKSNTLEKRIYNNNGIIDGFKYDYVDPFDI